MNDFERKLCQQPFRDPSPDLRAAILGGSVLSKVISPAVWTWRNWFWPSPQAWAGLAALWLAFAAISFHADKATPLGLAIPEQPAASFTLLTFHHTRDLDHVLELPN